MMLLIADLRNGNSKKGVSIKFQINLMIDNIIDITCKKQKFQIYTCKYQISNDSYLTRLQKIAHIKYEYSKYMSVDIGFQIILT